MRYLFYFCLLLSPAFADPFYSSSKGKPDINFDEDLAKSPIFSPPCQPITATEKIYLPIDLSQLKLIGFIQHQGKFKVLFLDKEKRLIELKENDFIVSSHLQIEKVSLKSVTFIDWKNSSICHEPHRIQLIL